MMTEPMIEVAGLSKRFGPVQAVVDLSFSVQRGEIVGFIGPNGAGKTTTMRMITGYLTPGRGGVVVDGIEVAEDPRAVRLRLGYLAERNPLYEEMRVEGYLRYRGQLKGLPRRRLRRAVDGVIAHCHLEDMRHRVIGTLSRGYRQRVGLADALVHDPTILILDEPTVGLDPNQVSSIRAYLREWARERTVILSTHILSEVEALCSRAILISGGTQVADAPVEELAARHGGSLEAAFRTLTAPDPEAA